MADYAAKPTKAKEDAGIIELRKRMLAVFLNRCRKMQEVRDDGVFWRFLDPNASWVRKLRNRGSVRTDNGSPERSTALSPRRLCPEERPQGSSSRSCEPIASAQLSSQPITIGEAEVWKCISKWHTHITSFARSPTLCSSAHDTWSASIWTISTGLQSIVGRRAGPILCQLRIIVAGAGELTAGQYGKGQSTRLDPSCSLGGRHG